MDESEIFAGCTRLRLSLADWLATLSEEQLDTPSLCADWTVRMVAGHLVAGVTVPTRRLIGAMLRHRLDVNRANTAIAAAQAAQPISTVIAALRDHAEAQLDVPVLGAYGPLGDLLVHGGDMRIPLGMAMPPEPELTSLALDRLTRGMPGLVPRSRLRGLALVATDADHRWLDGAEVRGRLGDLIMAVAGRPATLDRLDGRGVGILARRIDQ